MWPFEVLTRSGGTKGGGPAPGLRPAAQGKAGAIRATDNAPALAAGPRLEPGACRRADARRRGTAPPSRRVWGGVEMRRNSAPATSTTHPSPRDGLPEGLRARYADTLGKKRGQVHLSRRARGAGGAVRGPHTGEPVRFGLDKRLERIAAVGALRKNGVRFT